MGVNHGAVRVRTGCPFAGQVPVMVHRLFAGGQQDGPCHQGAEVVMEFRHLLSFLAIADELHFGRAAAKLHLLAPAVGEKLVGRGRVIKASARLVTASADVFAVNGDGEKHVATMLATIMPVRKPSKP